MPRNVGNKEFHGFFKEAWAISKLVKVLKLTKRGYIH